MNQRWATPTPELATFFIGVGVDFNRNGVELKRDPRIYGVELGGSCCLFATPA